VRQERQRLEWERTERERHEREVREKWEREQREKEQREQIERERLLREEQEQQRLEVEHQQATVSPPARIDNGDRNDLLNKLLMIDKKAGRDMSSDELNMRRRGDKVYQFSQQVENLHQGRPAHGSKENSSDDAGYMPSYGPGRMDSKQKTFNAEDKAKKSNLLEDLFGKQNASANNNNGFEQAQSASERDKSTSAQQLHAKIHHRRPGQATTTAAVVQPTVNVNKVDDDLEELLL
jgi:hypothetical protein